MDNGVASVVPLTNKCLVFLCPINGHFATPISKMHSQLGVKAIRHTLNTSKLSKHPVGEMLVNDIEAYKWHSWHPYVSTNCTIRWEAGHDVILRLVRLPYELNVGV
ncbi:hypothetical protein CsSME_00011679 [Camellia sinensis var. sinensis]